ncbi:MAG: ankyrin repeat domain-containing protein [Alphaproteobacteria bacterium]
MSWMKHSRRGRPSPPREPENGIVIAISNGDRGWLAALLQAGADTNAPHRGTLPLHLAARRGEFDIVDMLIARGAKIDGRDDAGRTALMIAAATGSAAEITALIQRGAAIDAADKEGNTAAHHAARALRFDHLARLVQAGADTAAANHAGETPRSLCAAEGGHAVSVLEQAAKDRAKIIAAQNATLQQSITLMPPLRFKPRTAGPR